MESDPPELLNFGLDSKCRNGSFQCLELHKCLFISVSNLEIFYLDFIRKTELTFFTNQPW